MSRFQGFSYPDAVVILDTHTGALTRVPLDGGAAVLLCPASAATPPRWRLASTRA